MPLRPHEPDPPYLRDLPTRLPEQREDRRARLVRLRQRGDTALAQDVEPRHARRFLRDVGIADPALGRLRVDDLRLRQADGELQTVLQGADRVLHVTELADRGLDLRQRGLRLRQQAGKLLLPGEIGENFKVMALTAGCDPDLPAFEYASQLHRL